MFLVLCSFYNNILLFYTKTSMMFFISSYNARKDYYYMQINPNITSVKY